MLLTSYKLEVDECSADHHLTEEEEEEEEEEGVCREEEGKKGRGEEGKGRGSGVTGGWLHGCIFPSLNFHTPLSLFCFALFS